MAKILLLALVTANGSARVRAKAPPSTSEDRIVATATIDPALDSPLFHQTSKRTADCVSTHQGKHVMDECSAEITAAQNLLLVISGGMPAYASTLSITIDPKLGYQCVCRAVYPAPTNRLQWKVTKQELKLKRTPGSRVYGWISVSFDEIDSVTGEKHNYKIEGYLRPEVKTRRP